MIDETRLTQEIVQKIADQITAELRGSLITIVEREIAKILSGALVEGEFYRRVNEDLQKGFKEIYQEINRRTGQKWDLLAAGAMRDPVAITKCFAVSVFPLSSRTVCRFRNVALARMNLNLPLFNCCSRYPAKSAICALLRAITALKSNPTLPAFTPQVPACSARCFTSAA